jgi:hypothetical protein
LCIVGVVLSLQFSAPVVNHLGEQSAAHTCCGMGGVSDRHLRQRVPEQSAGRSRSPYRNRIRVASPAKKVTRTVPETPFDKVNPSHSVEAATVPSSLAIAGPPPEDATFAPEPEMLRMEFQTADPNIKIIWLTPKEPTRTNPAADIQ